MGIALPCSRRRGPVRRFSNDSSRPAGPHPPAETCSISVLPVAHGPRARRAGRCPRGVARPGEPRLPGRSALVKLIVVERESDALFEFLRARPDRASSILSLVEVPRALRRISGTAVDRRRARRLLASLYLVDLDRRILAAAAAFEPAELRALDAIHLATAVALGEDLTDLITYDRRLAAAAERLDVPVLAPS